MNGLRYQCYLHLTNYNTFYSLYGGWQHSAPFEKRVSRDNFIFFVTAPNFMTYYWKGTRKLITRADIDTCKFHHYYYLLHCHLKKGDSQLRLLIKLYSAPKMGSKYFYLLGCIKQNLKKFINKNILFIPVSCMGLNVTLTKISEWFLFLMAR